MHSCRGSCEENESDSTEPLLEDADEKGVLRHAKRDKAYFGSTNENISSSSPFLIA